MIVPTWLLFGLGVLGATDIWLFHKRAHDLHSHVPARAELVTHFLRGPTYCVLFLLVPNFTFHGAALLGLSRSMSPNTRYDWGGSGGGPSPTAVGQFNGCSVPAST